MKAPFTVQVSACTLAFAFCVSATHAQTKSKMKMTTPIPPSFTTPDSVETRIGTLKFFDASPKPL